MAVTIAAVTSGKASGATSVTFSHTVSSGSDRALHVGGGTAAGTVPGVSSITFNASGLTQGFSGVGNTFYRCFGYYTVAPAVTTANVVVTTDTSGYIHAGAVSMTGVSQTSPVGTIPAVSSSTSNNTQNVALAVTGCQSNGLVLDSLFYGYSTTDGPFTSTVGTGQTGQYDEDDSTNGVRARGSSEAGAGTVTMQWTLTPTTEGGSDYGPYQISAIPYQSVDTTPWIRSSTTTSGTSASSAPVLNLPATISSGDTILVLFRAATGGAVGWPDGTWNELADSTDGSGDEYACAWRKSDGTEGGTTITLSSGGGRFASIAYAFAGSADPDTRAPEINTVATGSGAAQPDSSSITPTGGAKTYLYGSWYSMQGEQTAVSTYPSGYDLGNHFETSGTAGVASGNVTMGAGWKQVYATSDDPGAWSVSGTLDQWAAFSFVIHPASIPTAGSLAGRISLLGAGR